MTTSSLDPRPFHARICAALHLALAIIGSGGSCTTIPMLRSKPASRGPTFLFNYGFDANGSFVCVPQSGDVLYLDHQLEHKAAMLPLLVTHQPLLSRYEPCLRLIPTLSPPTSNLFLMPSWRLMRMTQRSKLLTYPLAAW